MTIFSRLSSLDSAVMLASTMLLSSVTRAFTSAFNPCECIFQGERLSQSLLQNYPSSNPGAYASMSAIAIYGTTCAPWDSMDGTPWKSYCPSNADFSGSDNWCKSPWCYVSADCDTKISSSVFAGSTTAYYSYDTCGAPDCYSSSTNPGCPYNPHGASYAVDKAGPCACTYQGSSLPASLLTNYPSSNPGEYASLPSISAYGTVCAAWDQIPDTPWASYCPVDADWCHQNNNWCQAAWCYVDASCPHKLASSVFSGSTTAYYSYTTCGAPDCYTGAYNEDMWPKIPWSCPVTYSENDYYVPADCKKGYSGTSKTVCKTCRNQCKRKCRGYGQKCKHNCVCNKCKHVCKADFCYKRRLAVSTESSSPADYV